MKSFQWIAVSVFLLAAPASFGAGFREGPKISTAQLTRWQLDKRLSKTLGLLTGGHLELNQTDKTATLVMDRQSNCPPEALCIALIPAPFTIKLSIVEEYSDDCNSHYVIAEEDRRLVDGALERLTIVDNTKNTCAQVIPLPETAVTYETELGRLPVHTNSYFTANQLVEIKY